MVHLLFLRIENIGIFVFFISRIIQGISNRINKPIIVESCIKILLSGYFVREYPLRLWCLHRQL